MEEIYMGRPEKRGPKPFIPTDLNLVDEYEEILPIVPLTQENLKKMSSEELSKHIEAILCRYANGEYLKDIFVDYGLSRWRWRNILAKNPQLQARCNEARESHIECLLEKMYQIADDSSGDTLTNQNTGVKYLNKEFVARSKLRIELVQWTLEKLERRKYYPSLNNDLSLAKKAALLTNAMLDGQLTSSQCAEVLTTLNQEANILKTHELEKRLELIEKNIPNK